MAAGMTPEQQAEVATNTQTVLHMLTVLERLTLLDDATLHEALVKTRWTIRRLIKRNWQISYDH